MNWTQQVAETRSKSRFKNASPVFVAMTADQKKVFDTEQEMVEAYAEAHEMTIEEAQALVINDSRMTPEWKHYRVIRRNPNSGYSSFWGEVELD